MTNEGPLRQCLEYQRQKADVVQSSHASQLSGCRILSKKISVENTEIFDNVILREIKEAVVEDSLQLSKKRLQAEENEPVILAVSTSTRGEV